MLKPGILIFDVDDSPCDERSMVLNKADEVNKILNEVPGVN